MKFKIFVFSLIFILVSNPSMTWAKSQSPNLVTIGFTPGDDPEWLKKNGIELAKILQSKLGVSFNIYISKNYPLSGRRTDRSDTFFRARPRARPPTVRFGGTSATEAAPAALARARRQERAYLI